MNVKKNTLIILCMVSLVASVTLVSAVAPYILGLSNSVPVDVTSNVITPVLSVSASAIVLGESVVLTADAGVNWAGSSITFFEGTTELGTATADASGVATLTIKPSTVGTHVYTAGPAPI